MTLVTVYETQDGKLFRNELDALRHENTLLREAAKDSRRREEREYQKTLHKPHDNSGSATKDQAATAHTANLSQVAAYLDPR